MLRQCNHTTIISNYYIEKHDFRQCFLSINVVLPIYDCIVLSQCHQLTIKEKLWKTCLLSMFSFYLAYSLSNNIHICYHDLPRTLEDAGIMYRYLQMTFELWPSEVNAVFQHPISLLPALVISYDVRHQLLCWQRVTYLWCSCPQSLKNTRMQLLPCILSVSNVHFQIGYSTVLFCLRSCIWVSLWCLVLWIKHFIWMLVHF